jgi:adenine-specific DNA methylase
MVDELRAKNDGDLTDLDRAAMLYVAFIIDKLLNFNSIETRWVNQRESVASTFDRHDFSFKWSYAEMALAATGVGYDWAAEQVGKALKEIITLLGVGTESSNGNLFSSERRLPQISVFNLNYARRANRPARFAQEPWCGRPWRVRQHWGKTKGDRAESLPVRSAKEPPNW